MSMRPILAVLTILCVVSSGHAQFGDTSICAPEGVCCLGDGSCEPIEGESFFFCVEIGGAFRSTCDGCPDDPVGACCINGNCTEMVSEATCALFSGDYVGDGIPCTDFIDCPDEQTSGACCIDVFCDQIEDDIEFRLVCILLGGTWIPNGECEECQPVGGCCIDDCCVAFESKLLVDEVNEAYCAIVGGTYLGDSILCDEINCVGDEPTDNGERAHPGWNHVSTEITLTKNEPAYWSASTGQPKGVAPLTVLDPGVLPGRPADDGTDDRVLRGYVVAWAVNSNNEEIRWNHLKGDAVLINYDEKTAWEYNAWAFQSVGAAAHGEQTGDPGVINLDGQEFSPGFDQLIVDFYATGSAPFGEFIHYVDTDLTIHPISVDLRQEDQGPVTTKLKIDVWNENEVKFNGAERCITCWDQTLMSRYSGFGVPNSFLFSTLQTNKGKARINGIRSDNCDLDFEFDPDVPFGDDPRDIVSQDASILGLAAKWITDESYVKGLFTEQVESRAGMNIHGAGTEAAIIRYDVLEQTPESTGGANLRRDRSQSVAGLLSDGTRRSTIAEGAAPAGQDRVSGSEKGSVLIFSKVEVRWNSAGNLIQDTFVDITNDFGEDVSVQMYFINGDAPLSAVTP